MKSATAKTTVGLEEESKDPYGELTESSGEEEEESKVALADNDQTQKSSNQKDAS